MKKNIGIDIGGTKVMLGVVDEEGTILIKKKIPMQPELSAENMIGQIAQEARRMLDDANIGMEEISFVGAGVPGTVDTAAGIVEYCPNICWDSVPAGKYFREALGKETLLSQDSRLAALGESLFGAGRDYGSIACITIGTGIGCGLIYGKKIFGGGLGTAGELGHIVCEADGRQCPCGNRGCLERYSSGTGILLEAKESYPVQFAGTVRTEDVFDLAYAGSTSAKEVIARSVSRLADGIVTLVNIFAPEAVIISGGLCEHKELVIEPLQNAVQMRGYPAWTRQSRLPVRKAELGADAPMIGASALYRGI
ncbi:MAG: ROK family protein [Christensenella sp.]|uniref:ROK family protein n=1 Tax=Christensenella sp. TaxID=1935934 RepID=UPI002B2091A3|nr:ROK family protein [Christensenella sp.]MEA5003098.1 ROK family protein [Christensenella sp.]